MFLVSLLTGLLLQSDTYLHVPVHQYSINKSTSFDYVQVYESNLENGMPNLGFSTGFNEDYIISTIEETQHNETVCELACNQVDNCMGYFMYHNETDYCNCNLLSNLGQAEFIDTTSKSFKKIVFHHPPIKEFVIEGIAVGPDPIPENITLYVDLNLNGRLDEGEPFNK